MSDVTLFTNVSIITPADERMEGWLVVRDGKISEMGDGVPPIVQDALTVNAGRLTLLPGFIDVHVHGSVVFDTMDADPDGLRTMAQFFAKRGVTGFLPTTWTDAGERITAALEVVAEMQGPQPEGASILGAHLEGPYLNAEKTGAQNPKYVRRADREEATAWLDLDVIRLLALAPEYEENGWLIDECVKRGITVSAAHTNATYEQMQAAIDRGVTQATHTYNAMTGLHHRKPGVVGAVLLDDRVRCELIADNVHVHPGAMAVVSKMKGADGVILITDAVRAAGQPDGEYNMDERTVVMKDGEVRLDDGTLAGSALNMNNGVRNYVRATGLPLEQAWRASSLNAAKAIGMADSKGSIEVGKDADIVLVDKSFRVHLTMVGGRVVYRDGI